MAAMKSHPRDKELQQTAKKLVSALGTESNGGSSALAKSGSHAHDPAIFSDIACRGCRLRARVSAPTHAVTLCCHFVQHSRQHISGVPGS